LKVGALHGKSADVVSARADFEAAVRAARRSTELATTDGENWRALYLAQWYLAVTAARGGDEAQALRLLGDALKSAEQAVRLLPKDRNIGEHVAILRNSVAQRSK
jgi:hypothetical protein